MTPKTSLKTLLLAAAATLGLVTFASAQATNVAPPNPAAAAAKGLLGQTYSGVTFDYLQLKDGPPSAGRGFTLTYNQVMNDGFDGGLNYQVVRAEAGGQHYTRNRLDFDLTAFSTSSAFGKPFVTAGAGWEWNRGTVSENSFMYLVGAGLEFQTAPAVAVTPYINFVRATGFNQNQTEYGVKTSYRINREWSAVAKIQYNDITHEPNNTQYSLGVNFHF